MKRIAIAVVASIVGLAVLAAIPALADVPATGPHVTCPYHDSAVMPDEDMDVWMSSAQHREWMLSEEHSDMHRQMSAGHGMMSAGRGMMGGGGMAGSGGMMGSGPVGR